MRSLLLTLLIASTALLLGCADASSGSNQSGDPEPLYEPDVDISALAEPDTATFGGGCFWCMEPPYDEVEGVAATISGFSGGHVEHPSYDDVTAGGTGHIEVVQVIYDAEVVGYERLLDIYWRNIDPLDDGGQFCDRGAIYAPVIFAHNDMQRDLAESTKAAIQERFDEEVVVPVESFDAFYPAEEYHQNFYQKNPGHYNRYRQGCGRDARLDELWGDEARAEHLSATS